MINNVLEEVHFFKDYYKKTGVKPAKNRFYILTEDLTIYTKHFDKYEYESK